MLAGGVPRLTLIVSTAGGPFTPLCWFSPGMPWRTAWTMSVRLSSGAPDVEQRVQHRRELRLHDVLAVQRGVAVRRRPVELVLLPERDDDLVHQRVAEPGDLHPAAARVRRLPLTWSRRRSVVDHTPTTAFRASGPETARWFASDQPLGQLHDDRVDVVSAQVVLALALVAGELAEVDARRTSRRGRRRTDRRAARRTASCRRAASGSPRSRSCRSSGTSSARCSAARPAGRVRASAPSRGRGRGGSGAVSRTTVYRWMTFSFGSPNPLAPGRAYRNEFLFRTFVLKLNR